MRMRKGMRLESHDYNTPGAYFITICTKDRKAILATIDVGTGVLDGPKIRLKPYGETARRYLLQMDDFYDHIAVDHYVIMPNHIHLLLRVLPTAKGPSGTPVPPSRQNTTIAQFVSTFKRFCNRELGHNIWQYRSYDHVIRGEQDYNEIWQYIDNNPAKWEQDRLYAGVAFEKGDDGK